MSNTILSILQFILLYQMEADFIERIVKLKLTSEEGEAILVRPTQRAKTLEEYSNSSIGKFLTSRQINLRAAKNIL